MIKGKDEEKITVPPLFPRLHLNDTEKGGPKAPPRNKMALYEQLSIPSHRFKQGSVSSERGVCFSVQSSVSKVPLLQPPSEKESEEEDFRVPVFLQTNVQECKSQNVEENVEEECMLNNEKSVVEASETSMVDCVSDSTIISPDDFLDIIGQNYFWKARKTIVNQQRVFAVQVFELHRLIKVQQLMASSPDLLHNKSSSTMKLPMDYIVKRPPDVIIKPNHVMECSAEINVASKESLPSKQNGGAHQPSSKPDSVNSPLTVNPSDKVPWCQNQWLMPVMSPTEGLVYKPYYPSPGMITPFCGGCGPPGPPPIASSSFISSGYGPQGFFPPRYANIPVTSHHSITNSGTDQTNHLATSGLPIHPPLMETNNNNNNNTKSQTSFGKDDKIHGAIRDSSDVEASTESSAIRQGRGNSCNNTPPQQHVADPPAGVIKAVPHVGISATESAGRIFQSIQQQRKQRHVTAVNDSVDN